MIIDYKLLIVFLLFINITSRIVEKEYEPFSNITIKHVLKDQMLYYRLDNSETQIEFNAKSEVEISEPIKVKSIDTSFIDNLTYTIIYTTIKSILKNNLSLRNKEYKHSLILMVSAIIA